MITYEQFKDIYEAIEGEPEFFVYLEGTSPDGYVIIKHNDGPSFQRECDPENRGETFYASLDELYHATQIDDICLKRDWSRIYSLVMGHAFDLFYPDELQDCWNVYVSLTAKSNKTQSPA